MSMRSKRVLIVDDEETILRLLKSSLISLSGSYEVMTANNGETALELFRRDPFDLVVTDYMMGGMDGMQLLEAVQQLVPETRVIMITAYGSTELEQQAHDLKVYRYLTKPLEIATFRLIVKEALEYNRVKQTGSLIMPDSRTQQVDQHLEKLLVESGARCVLFCEINGTVITKVGNTEGLPVDDITSLLGGSIATILQVGVKIDGEGDVSNLAYREGKQKDLYALNIGRTYLLILMVDRAEFSNKLGAVWYYARRTAIELRNSLGEV
jgi:CheY-like chemotaxis protein